MRRVKAGWREYAVRFRALQPGISPLGIVGKRGRRFALPGGRLQLKLKSDLKQ